MQPKLRQLELKVDLSKVYESLSAVLEAKINPFHLNQSCRFSSDANQGELSLMVSLQLPQWALKSQLTN